MIAFNKKYLVLCVSSATVLFSGCYNYPAIPDSVNQSTYTDLKTDQQKLLPADCRVLNLELSEQIAMANLASSRVNLENAKAQMEAAIGTR